MSQVAQLQKRIVQLEATVREQAAVIDQLKEVLEINRRQAEVIEKLERRIKYLEKQLYGPKSERMPQTSKVLRSREKKLSAEERAELKRKRRKKADLKRKANQEKTKELETETIHHPVPESQCVCPECGNKELDLVSEGRTTEIIEMKLQKVVRQIHIQEVRSCKCGGHITTAPGPERVVEGGKYGPGVYARTVVGKCVDSLPLNRQAGIFEREGVHIAPSVLGTMFHQAAFKFRILHEALRKELVKRDHIQADETTIKSQTDRSGKRKKKSLQQSYMWLFLSGHTPNEPTILYYRYSMGRSKAETPDVVLKGYAGTLLTDGYGGYNPVEGVHDATRAGCMSHCRRKFFEALENYPLAKDVLEWIVDLYEIEDEAKAQGIVGTDAHRELRKEKSVPLMKKIHAWSEEHQQLANPSNDIHDAITYVLNQWETLKLFIEDPLLPLDNNRSERNLRIIAIGRKNYLFVGNHEAGESLAILQSLTATALANGVNPELYIKDILLRVNKHPVSDLHQLLPWNWAKQFMIKT